MVLSRGRLLGVVAALLVLGSAVVVVAVNSRHDRSTPVTMTCPAEASDLPAVWAVVQGATVGAYELVEAVVCPAPMVRRRIRSDVSGVTFGGGRTAVVDYTGPYDQVSWLDHDKLTPVPGPRLLATYTPGLSRNGDLAYTGFDGKQMSLYVRVAGATETIFVHRSAPGVALHNPSWNAAGELAVLEGPLRPNAPEPTTILLYAQDRLATPRRIPLGRSQAVRSFFVTDRTLAVVDGDGLSQARTRLVDLDSGKTTPLPSDLYVLDAAPGGRLLLARGPQDSLVLLSGAGFTRRHALGPLSTHHVEVATFVPVDAEESAEPAPKRSP